MKHTNSNIRLFATLSLLAFLSAHSCLAQVTNIINATNVGLASEEFQPTIRGITTNDHVVAREISRKEGTHELRPVVLLNTTSGEAISASSTNDVCLFKRKFYRAVPAAASHAVFINISQPFGTNEFSAVQAQSFIRRIGADYVNLDSPHRKLIHLESVLKAEDDPPRSAYGTPLRHVELNVERGKLVLLFESFTHIKGKVTLDDQLNPSSVTITDRPPTR